MLFKKIHQRQLEEKDKKENDVFKFNKYLQRYRPQFLRNLFIDLTNAKYHSC